MKPRNSNAPNWKRPAWETSAKMSCQRSNCSFSPYSPPRNMHIRCNSKICVISSNCIVTEMALAGAFWWDSSPKIYFYRSRVWFPKMVSIAPAVFFWKYHGRSPMWVAWYGFQYLSKLGPQKSRKNSCFLQSCRKQPFSFQTCTRDFVNVLPKLDHMHESWVTILKHLDLCFCVWPEHVSKPWWLTTK